MPNICVAYLFGENYSELAALCRPSLIAYCQKHKYDCNIKCVPPNEKGNYSFIRIKHARELLDHYDVVLMLEGDMMITSMNYNIEELIDNDHDFYCASDVNGKNTASFIIKNTEWGKTLMDIVYKWEDILGDEQNYFEHTQHEKIKIIPHPSINSIPYKFYSPSYGYINWKSIQPPPTLPKHEQGNWQIGDFICHTPGKPLSERIAIFEEIKKFIVYE